MKKWSLSIYLVIFTVFLPSKGWAILTFEDHAFPEFVTSSRALAMGNAYIAKVDGPWAAFYNPAGLGTVRTTNFHLLNMHAELNGGFNDLVSSQQLGDTFGNSMDLMSAEGMRQLITQPGFAGTTAHSRVNFFPNFTTRYFQLGYLYSNRARGRLRTPSSLFEWAERVDQGPVMGLNFSLWGGIFKFGASATYLMRTEVQQDYDPNTPITITNEDRRKGNALIYTVGSKLTLPVAWLPTFAVVARNASAKGFQADNTINPAPESIRRTYDVGFSVSPYFGKMSHMHFEVNVRDVLNNYSIDFKRRLSVGLEFDYKRAFFVRLGSGDGWGSGGIGIKTKRLIIDITSYAVEASTDDTAFRESEDRRFVLSISSGF